MPATSRARRKCQLIGKSQWCCSANCGHPLHALRYNWTRGMQLANTPPLQSTTPGLHPVSFHQMAPSVRENTHPITAYYSVYRPRKDERLSRPGWLVTYRNKVPPPGVEPERIKYKLAVIVYWALHGTAPQYLSDQLRYVADLPTRHRGRLRSSTSSLLEVCPSQCVTVGDRSLSAHDSGTVYLMMSSLPYRLQYFAENWKLIYSGNHTQTLFYSLVTIVVLAVIFT